MSPQINQITIHCTYGFLWIKHRAKCQDLTWEEIRTYGFLWIKHRAKCQDLTWEDWCRFNLHSMGV
ncbi:hypothetical protein HanIR_Chr17g0876341 [Helianthus annuus]|nr:hypothetical protein HanIR_Chr17g0876341 [Helianthus annuus]